MNVKAVSKRLNWAFWDEILFSVCGFNSIFKPIQEKFFWSECKYLIRSIETLNKIFHSFKITWWGREEDFAKYCLEIGKSHIACERMAYLKQRIHNYSYILFTSNNVQHLCQITFIFSIPFDSFNRNVLIQFGISLTPSKNKNAFLSWHVSLIQRKFSKSQKQKKSNCNLQDRFSSVLVLKFREGFVSDIEMNSICTLIQRSQVAMYLLTAWVSSTQTHSISLKHRCHICIPFCRNWIKAYSLMYTSCVALANSVINRVLSKWKTCIKYCLVQKVLGFFFIYS